MKLLSLAILLLSSLPALAQFGAQAVSAGRWEPRNYTNSLGVQLLFCSYWTNGILTNSPTTVSYWTNRLENGFDLAQGTALSQPTLTNDAPWGGLCLYFDGSDDSMATGAMASMVQPTVVIWGGRQVTWTDNDTILGDTGSNYAKLYQRTSSPNLRIYANGTPIDNGDLALGEWGVVSSIFNITSSSLTVDNSAPVTGNLGNLNLSGVRLGGHTAVFSNIETFGLLVMTNTSAVATNYARLGFLGMANTK